MRRLGAIFVGLLCLAAIAGCSHSEPPPIGRWEGVYQSSDTMVAARFEIAANGQMFLSAPNAEDIAAGDDRQAIRQRLAQGLAAGWDDVQPVKLEFDGKTFRKPGGIAPQAEWNSGAQKMTLIVYLGRGAVRIPMRSVKTFSANPFAPG